MPALPARVALPFFRTSLLLGRTSGPPVCLSLYDCCLRADNRSPGEAIRAQNALVISVVNAIDCRDAVPLQEIHHEQR